MARKLYRSRTERMIWGVCGGLAEYFDIDPTFVRLAAVLSIFVSGLGVLAYILMAIFVPLESSTPRKREEELKENIEEIRATAAEVGQRVRSAFAGAAREDQRSHDGRGGTLRAVGIILILLGIIFILSNLRLFWWLRPSYIWPIVMIAIGLLILLSRRNG